MTHGTSRFFAVFLKRTGRFSQDALVVDIDITIIDPSCFPRLELQFSIGLAEDSFVYLSHTELSYQLYTSFHTA